MHEARTALRLIAMSRAHAEATGNSDLDGLGGKVWRGRRYVGRFA
jgi:hypothetical protein